MHAICVQRASNLLNDFIVRGNPRECQRQCRTVQAVQVLMQLKDAPVIEPQTFPHGIATLDRRIEWADPCFVAVHEAAVDVDQEMAILFVKLLEHREEG
jgi:hypothetical protein